VNRPLDQHIETPGLNAVSVEQAAAWLGSSAAHFVWRNDEGGLTFVSDDGAHYLTWVPSALSAGLLGATERAAWVRQFVPAPRFGPVRITGDGAWCVSDALAGASAIGPWGQAHPREAARAIGAGLRQLHDAAPVGQCPFRWALAPRLARARDRLQTSPAWRDAPDDYFADWTDTEAREVLALEPAPDLVVCHGDACSPNYLVDDYGNCTGIVDVGALGVADRWADLAVASWSINWNFSPGWEGELFDAYGIARDEPKLRFYRLMWQLS